MRRHYQGDYFLISNEILACIRGHVGLYWDIVVCIMLALLHDLGITFPLRHGLGKDIFFITILAQASAQKQDNVRKWMHSTIMSL